MISRGKAEKQAARAARLSAALRENLKRRKAQARGRARCGGPCTDGARIIRAACGAVPGDVVSLRHAGVPRSGEPGMTGGSKINRPLRHGERRFLDRFGQRRVGVAGAGDVLGRRAEFHGDGGLADHVAGIGP